MSNVEKKLPKKFLYITHLSGKTINRLWLSAIMAANELGMEVHLACNMEQIEPEEWNEGCKKYKITTHQIDFDRNPISSQNVKAKKQLLELMKREKFDVVHCNTPIGGVLGRLCAKKAGVPYVLYQAHGFHFWKGAPLKNWLFYYPVEKYLAKYNDALITINQEDFEIAKKFVKAKAVLVHGVGVDLKQFNEPKQEKMSVREKLGISNDAFVIISVGELIPRKNHEIAIEAFQKANIPNSVYLICGEGSYRKELEQKIEILGLKGKVLLLGFRHDVRDILAQSDLFCFPSLQEGLPVALMEAMATGIPCIASSIRGNTDLLPKSQYLFEPTNVKTLAQLMEKASGADFRIEKEKNAQTIRSYAFDKVLEEMKNIYRTMMNMR